MYAYQGPYPAYVTAAGQPTPIVYAAQFPIPGYPALYGIVKAPTPTNQFHSAPDIPAISSEIASKQMQKLIVSQLQAVAVRRDRTAGTRPPGARKSVAFVQKLYEGAHDYANLACRASPVAMDVLAACDAQGVRVNDLQRHRNHVKVYCCRLWGQRSSLHHLDHVPPTSSHQMTKGLRQHCRRRCGQIPSNFPPLPPKHSYLKTPASPPRKAALAILGTKAEDCIPRAGIPQELTDSYLRTI
ncbi:hypothetical protein EDD16DRAFT_1757898 [Pisolithus croceorrhizus]|nr:hypothetical protein EDD16DRAFT_1757898 [Pisolithus croceorrhizus]